jgi:S1-C subfamily serine protease
VAIIVVFVVAMIGQLLASGLGVAMRARLTWRPATVLDSIGGAGVSVVSVLLIAWLIATSVAYAPFPLISQQVNSSAVLRGVDRIMPPDASLVFSDFRSLLARGPYTQVFGALGAEGALSVGPPDPVVLSSGGLRHAKRSIVKVEGTAPSCRRQIEGSGFVISRNHVLTNAHVVAGVKNPDVVTLRHGELRARVVFYDPEGDVAILYVPHLSTRSLAFAGPASAGENAIVAGYPHNDPFTAVAARVASSERARSPDIYQRTTVTREIYPIRAVVEPGNSGGPLLAPNGQVYGVVFAAAVSVKNTGYALTAQEVAKDVAAGRSAVSEVSTQSCDN